MAFISRASGSSDVVNVSHIVAYFKWKSSKRKGSVCNGIETPTSLNRWIAECWLGFTDGMQSHLWHSTALRSKSNGLRFFSFLSFCAWVQSRQNEISKRVYELCYCKQDCIRHHNITPSKYSNQRCRHSHNSPLFSSSAVSIQFANEAFIDNSLYE